MQVRLHLRLIRVLTVVVDTIDQLVVSVTSTRSWSRCPHCGFACRRVHDVRQRRIRDLSVSGRPVTLVWQRRRLACDGCGERHLEDHGEFEGRLTRRLSRLVVADARVMSIRAVAAVTAWVGPRSWSWWPRGRPWWWPTGARSAAGVLLVDETSMRRRHRYVTVLQNGQTGEVLAMEAHRNEAAPSRFLVGQGQRWCRGVTVVVTDGSKSYRAAVERHLGHATHVLDRFHVVRWFAAGLTLVRREAHVASPGARCDRPSTRAVPLPLRLLRRADTLAESDRQRLEDLFCAIPASAWPGRRCRSSTGSTWPTTRRLARRPGPVLRPLRHR